MLSEVHRMVRGGRNMSNQHYRKPIMAVYNPTPLHAGGMPNLEYTGADRCAVAQLRTRYAKHHMLCLQWQA